MSIEQMSLWEKTGQLFFIRPEGLTFQRTSSGIENTSAQGVTEITDEMREAYRSYPCGGFCLFYQNIISPEQLMGLTHALHSLGESRPVLCIDEEGGRVTRIAARPAFDVPTFPTAQEQAAMGDAGKVSDEAWTIGQYLKTYGFDVDFAPVADVNTNPLNPVIGDRAFGEDPGQAGRMVQAYLNGLHSAGIAGCIKHFPGHGDTSTDTHLGYAETKKTWEQLLECEIIPFRAGIQAGTDMIMTAHIAAPLITGSEEPSTMSRMMLTQKLRGEIGFDGLIITDALEMGAIVRTCGSAEAAVRCLQAGADLLLMPYDYREAYEGVYRAVKEGTLTESRIDESVARLMRLKQHITSRTC